jgi:hypothetical protein
MCAAHKNEVLVVVLLCMLCGPLGARAARCDWDQCRCVHCDATHTTAALGFLCCRHTTDGAHGGHIPNRGCGAAAAAAAADYMDDNPDAGANTDSQLPTSSDSSWHASWGSPSSTVLISRRPRVRAAPDDTDNTDRDERRQEKAQRRAVRRRAKRALMTAEQRAGINRANAERQAVCRANQSPEDASALRRADTERRRLQRAY